MPAVDHDPIVVGVRHANTAAVTWASRQAAIEGRPLRLVHARAEDSPWLLPGGLTPANWRAEASSMTPVLDHALDVVEALRADQCVSACIEIASPAGLLVREAGPTSIIVVGNHGTSPLRHAVTGTIWQAILTRSSRPLVAVTGSPVWPDAPIVVGIDQRGTARAAVEFGYAQAARCAVPLHLFHVLRPGPTRAAAIAGVISRHRVLEYAQHYPQVTSTVFHVAGDPVRQLTDAAADAQLLVVGSRGRRAVSGLLTRSVSHALLRNAPCPIAVVPRRHY